MSQVNVNPGNGPVYRDDGTSAAAAGINFLVLIIVLAVIVVLAVLAYGAFAGGWFSGPATRTNGGGTNITVQAPQGQTTSRPAGGSGVTVQSPSASASTSTSSAPAASR